MRKAKLIKQKEWQSAQQEERVDRPDNQQPRRERTAVETATEWVRERQKTERLSPRKRFAALFS
jgi:hypothetical protein